MDKPPSTTNACPKCGAGLPVTVRTVCRFKPGSSPVVICRRPALEALPSQDRTHARGVDPLNQRIEHDLINHVNPILLARPL